MKKHQQTDRIIKEKMEQYSMGTPMHLFAGIAEALDAEAVSAPAPQKSSWKRGYWILTLLALVVCGSGVWFLTSDDNSSNEVGAEMSIILNSDDAKMDLSKIGGLGNKDIATGKGGILSTKNEINNSIESNSEFVNEKIETSISNLNVSAVFSFEEVNIERTNVAKTSTRNIAKSNSTRSNFFETTTPKDILTQKGGTSEVNISLNLSVSNLPNGQNNLPIQQVGKINTNVPLGEKSIAADASENIITTKKATEEIFNLPKLNQLANSSISYSSPYRLAVQPACGLKPDGSKVRFTTSIDAFFSPDFANQILEYKSEDFREHAQQRKDTEKPYYSFNTGVRVNFLTEFGWAIRTGLVYTQINEILETQYTEIVTTLDVYGNVVGTTEGTRDVNIRNKYKMIDIPIIFGYEVPMKKFDLNVNGGIYMNLMSKQSGAFFSPIEDRVVYFTEGHPDDYDIFKNNIGLSVFVGLGFNFDLTNAFNADKKTQLIVEPHARFYPKSFALDNYILNQKYFSTGVMIGLRRNL
jgi:hypothetical protein